MKAKAGYAKILTALFLATCIVASWQSDAFAQAPAGETLLGFSLESGFGTFTGGWDVFLPVPSLDLYVYLTYWLELRLGLSYHYYFMPSSSGGCTSDCASTHLLGVPTADLMVKYNLPIALFWRAYVSAGFLAGVPVYRRTDQTEEGGSSYLGETLLGYRVQFGFGEWFNLKSRYRFGIDYQMFWTDDKYFSTPSWKMGMYGGLFVGFDFKL